MRGLVRSLKKKRRMRHAVKSIRQTGIWFVDIPRTSSTAVKIELGRHFGPAYGKTNVIETHLATEQMVPDHLTAAQMRKQVGAKHWNKLSTFTIVRNPWDRVLSLYNYLSKRQGIPEDWSFTDFLERMVRADADTPFFMFQGVRLGAMDYILDEDGTVLVKHIIRYENRAEGLTRIAGILDLPELGQLQAQKASPASYDYRDFYTSRTRDLVGERFAQDVLLLGYEF